MSELPESQPEEVDIRENKFKPLPKQEEFIKSGDKMVMLSGGFGTGKCTHEDTRIRLADGTHKPIKNVKPGETVLSMSPSFKFNKNKVIDKVDTGTKDGYRIHLQGGREIIVSKDHPLFKVSEKKRKNNSPYHFENKRKVVPTKYKWDIADNLEDQDLIAVPKVETKQGQNKRRLEDYYLLGLILGDGSISTGNVEYSTADKSVVNKIESILRDPVSLNKYNNSQYAYSISTGYNDGEAIEDRPTNYVQEMLREYGLLETDSHTKFIPDEIYTSTNKAISNILSGLIVTDGWVDNQCLGYSSVSKELARGVHELFNILGIDSRFNEGRVLYKGKYRTTYRVEISRGVDLNLCKDKLDILHKQDDLKQLADSKSTSNLRGVNNRYYNNDVAFHRVKEVEQMQDIPTYDLEVEQDHNYIGNGIVMHNSRVGCEKGYFLNMQYPGNRGLIVRRHFSDVKASTIQQTLLEEVIPESHIVDHNKSDHIIKHKTGTEDPTEEPVLSEIHYHGLDSGKSTGDDDLPRKIGSMAYGWIFVDEGSELSKGEWTQLQGRLRYTGNDQGGMHYPVPFRQIFTATNPDAPTHWMYDLFFDKEQGKVIEMSVDDNIHLADDYVENMKNQFQGVYYDRYFEGKWVGAEGMIYEAWNRDKHLRDWDELPGNWTKEMEQNWANDEGKGVWATPPDNWQIYRSIDFGYNNPFVCQYWARSPDDELILFREIYKTETLVEDIAKQIKSNDPNGFPIEQTFADHDAEDAATLRRHGVNTSKAKKDVSQGIQAVMSRLRLDERDRPRLYVMRNARIHPPDDKLNDNNDPLNTREEIPTYTWKDEDDDKPEKEDDHGCDAMRYMVYSLDSGNTPSQDEMEGWAEIVNQTWQ